MSAISGPLVVDQARASHDDTSNIEYSHVIKKNVSTAEPYNHIYTINKDTRRHSDPSMDIYVTQCAFTNGRMMVCCKDNKSSLRML